MIISSIPLAHEESARRSGGHLEAVVNQSRLYDSRLTAMRHPNVKHFLNILDFGSGRYGIGRALLENQINQYGDRMYLYDPYTDVKRSVNSQVFVAENLDNIPENIDFINISYVLCSMEPDEARQALSDLKNRFNRAEIFVLDYVLNGREELINLLQSNEECKWRQIQGEKEFRRTRTRFTAGSLKAALMESGLEIIFDGLHYLDSNQLRCAAIAKNTNRMLGAVCLA